MIANFRALFARRVCGTLAALLFVSCQPSTEPVLEEDEIVRRPKLSPELFAKRNSKSNSGGSSMITFAGRRWYVRSSTSWTGPGLNVFSSSTNNVWVDSQGMLHLKITKVSGKWQCAEIFSADTVGYGEYTFQLASQADKIDKNAVFGMFTWDNNTFQSDGNSEIDIEFAKWGKSWLSPLLYSVQPTGSGSYTERNYTNSGFVLNQDNSTHFFKWAPTQVSFNSYYGHGTGTPAGSWSFYDSSQPRRKIEGSRTSDLIVIPKPGTTTRLHLNLWLNDSNGDGYGDAPSDGQAVEVVVKSVDYRPL